MTTVAVPADSSVRWVWFFPISRVVVNQPASVAVFTADGYPSACPCTIQTAARTTSFVRNGCLDFAGFSVTAAVNSIGFPQLSVADHM